MFVLTLVLAAAAMAANDAIATLLTVAEARGLAFRASVIAAFQDVASIAKTICGALVVAANGWSWKSVAVAAVIGVTSATTAYFSVKSTNRWGRARTEGAA